MMKNYSPNPPSFLLKEKGLSVEFGRNLWCQPETFCFLSEPVQEHLLKIIPTLFKDNQLNSTEKRPVTHVAWRDIQQHFPFLNRDKIKKAHERMFTFAETIEKEKAIKHIVNVGIGGSYLGNLLLSRSLKDFDTHQYHVHFLSSPDPSALEDLFTLIDPEKTLWLFTSKSFNSLEVFISLEFIKAWYSKNSMFTSFEKNAFAITSNIKKAQQEGFSENQCFWFDEGVGGRFSLWSSVGLIILFMIGRKNFEALLAGAHAMDLHFLHKPLKENIPVMLAWSDYFYAHEMKSTSRAIIPYSIRFKKLPLYLQQLEMESLGKHNKGNHGMVVWGDIGPNAQHSFHQFLYQNKQIIPVEFLLVKESLVNENLQFVLLAECLAQSKALWEGFFDEENLHKHIDPYNPSTIILLEKITPYNLGMLLAMYEHKVFVLAELYKVNAFDQFGVELGKIYTKSLLAYFNQKKLDKKLDPISDHLIELLK